MSSLPTHPDGLGNFRPLGFRTSPPEKRLLLASYRDQSGLIHESDWCEFDEWPEQVAIKDQNGKGACNGHACALGIEFDRAVAGKPHVPLSAWFVYSILCNGVDEGSMISDDLALITSKGCAPESEVTYGTINPKKLTSSAYAEALRFKADIGSAVTTREEIASAVLRRHSVNLAISVGNNFNDLDSEGVPPLDRGPCNHAVFVGGGMKKSKKWGWLVKMANSWTTEWGLKGFCWLPLDVVPKGAYFEGYHLSSVHDDPKDDTQPPKV